MKKRDFIKCNKYRKSKSLKYYTFSINHKFILLFVTSVVVITIKFIDILNFLGLINKIGKYEFHKLLILGVMVKVY